MAETAETKPSDNDFVEDISPSDADEEATPETDVTPDKDVSNDAPSIEPAIGTDEPATGAASEEVEAPSPTPEPALATEETADTDGAIADIDIDLGPLVDAPVAPAVELDTVTAEKPKDAEETAPDSIEEEMAKLLSELSGKPD